MATLKEINLPGLPKPVIGKVRNAYDLDNCLLMVASDRLSAFDVVLPDGIPGKGAVLNLISNFWFKIMQDIVPNHIITTNVDEFPEICASHKDILSNRSVLVKKCSPFPVECIVRGYITGSGWSSYKKEGHVCDIPLPKGLKESEKLTTPLFTPSTKAPQGNHDINVSLEEAGNEISDKMGLNGAVVIRQLKQLSLAIYETGALHALKKGIIIADTKFEFGLYDGEIILIDEVLTPDSSRFWPADKYEPGRGQESFDKQAVRDWLSASGWDKKAPGPNLPQTLIDETSGKYADIYERLTGEEL